MQQCGHWAPILHGIHSHPLTKWPKMVYNPYNHEKHQIKRNLMFFPTSVNG
uniref:Uncharacterized protein n=1 Tax=Anguilla anguilla TaxID=7936 RepID=A0A0E9W2M9_ANGAN